jgi:hypothetical protein
MTLIFYAECIKYIMLSEHTHLKGPHDTQHNDIQYKKFCLTIGKCNTIMALIFNAECSKSIMLSEHTHLKGGHDTQHNDIQYNNILPNKRKI